MSSLGSIYDDDPLGEKGRDLSAAVDVPRNRLGAPYVVEVPLLLMHEGAQVRRAIGIGEEGAQITLSLPEDLPDTVKLRLRGQGEEVDDGPNGDLLLHVQLIAHAPPVKPPGGWIVAVIVVSLGVLGWLLAG